MQQDLSRSFQGLFPPYGTLPRISQPGSSSNGDTFFSNIDSNAFSSNLSLEYNSARKRARQTLNPQLMSVNDPQVNWECHPVYDIMIHSSDCSVCHAYLTHLVESGQQPSFQIAMKSRDRRRDAHFFDGVSEGRRRQRDDDDQVFEDRERYRKERNDAMEALSRLRIDVHDGREELRMVKDHLHASQAECHQLRQQAEVLLKEKIDFANQLQIQQKARQGPPLAINHQQPSPDPILPTIQENSAPSPPPRPIMISYAAVASSGPAPASCVTSNGQRSSHLPVRPTPAISTPAHTSPPQNPKTLRQLQALMSAAHEPGNEAALARVKVLCSEAHATPRDSKTDIHRFLLANWRNPVPGKKESTTATSASPSLALLRTATATGASAGYTKMNPRTDDPVEVWYEYLCTHRTSWPRGVRRDDRNRPRLADLKASRTVARLRPEVGLLGNPAPRAEFMTCVVEIFATPGAYQAHLESSNFKVAPCASFRPYRGPIPMTIKDVVRHFADCGVSVPTASEEMEPWAQSYLASTPV